MQILIRRQGVSVRAEWDGLAKPSDKQLHYWLRVRPQAPVANAGTTATVTDSLLVGTVANQAYTTVQVQNYTLVLDLLDVVENRAASPALPTTHRSITLSALRLWQNRSVTPARPSLDPRLQMLSLDGYGPNSSRLVSLQHVVSAQGYQSNTFHAKADNAFPVTLPSTVQARQGSVILRAPLPSGSLLQPVDVHYDPTPAPTNPDHMELVTSISDALAHTHWSRTPKPTHFVQESQTPVEPEVVRDTAPEILFLGGAGNDLRSYGNGATTLCNIGPWEEFRKRGKRGSISNVSTNGLTPANYDASYSNGYRAFTGMSDDALDTSGAGQWRYSSRWQVRFSGYPWVSVDFGRTVPGIRGVGMFSSRSSRHVRYFAVYTSLNGTSWGVAGYYYLAGNYQWQTFYFTPRDARFVKIECRLNWGHDDYIGIDNAEIYMV